jgi:hypothetical protein
MRLVRVASGVVGASLLVAALAGPAAADCLEADASVTWFNGTTTATPWTPGTCLLATPWGAFLDPYVHDWSAAGPYREVTVSGSIPSP